MPLTDLASTDQLRIGNLIFGILFGILQILLLTRRIFQIREAGSKEACSILTIWGVAVVVFGIAICIMITLSNVVHPTDRTCAIGMKFAIVVYCGMRLSVYMFLVYRIDVVQVLTSSKRFVMIVKWGILICYTSGVAIAAFFTQGSLKDGEVSSCRGEFQVEYIFLAAFMDFIICLIATLFFLKPLKEAAKNQGEDVIVVALLKKMRFYGYVMISSTVLAIFFGGAFGGLQLIWALESGITSTALVLMYEQRDVFFKKKQVSLSCVAHKAIMRKVTTMNLYGKSDTINTARINQILDGELTSYYSDREPSERKDVIEIQIPVRGISSGSYAPGSTIRSIHKTSPVSIRMPIVQENEESELHFDLKLLRSEPQSDVKLLRAKTKDHNVSEVKEEGKAEGHAKTLRLTDLEVHSENGDIDKKT